MIKEGTIIKNISNTYSVLSDNYVYDCKARGKFRNDKIIPLVGDHVLFDSEKKYILEIQERKNVLKRPQVANLDVALIVTSLKDPDISFYLLDKLISMVTINNVTPVICITKEDLIDEMLKLYYDDIFNYYESIGIKVIKNYETDKLKKYLKGKVVTLAGQTGAGKSSLLNRLDETLNLATNPISKALGRGVHTTRYCEIHKIDEIWFLDTPGFSSLDLKEYTKEQIKDSFVEFKNNDCLYKDCSHINTDGCEIVEKVNNNIILKSRYNSYCNLIDEMR